eukprot:8445248-Pyramimonas_sp.AAC.1
MRKGGATLSSTRSPLAHIPKHRLEHVKGERRNMRRKRTRGRRGVTGRGRKRRRRCRSKRRESCHSSDSRPARRPASALAPSTLARGRARLGPVPFHLPSLAVAFAVSLWGIAFSSFNCLPS